MSTVPPTPKTPSIVVNLKVTIPGKDNMSLADLNGFIERAKKLRDAAATEGKVEGTVTIGKQKYDLAD